jgi:hypothetical protein
MTFAGASPWPSISQLRRVRQGDREKFNVGQSPVVAGALGHDRLALLPGPR